jgi:4-amino-4-deoxy-L-arabinose transferase-like glycosyltransferase
MWNRVSRSGVVLVFIAALYALWLWQPSIPLTGDQKTYISIALEMRERSEWIVPYLFDRPNFLKPPLQYWATLVGWKLFGFSVFGTLFPSLFALLVSSALVRELSVDRSWLRALYFSATVSVMTYGTTAQMEIWLVLFYLASWYFYLRNRWGIAWVCAGVMAWIKGPLYPVLWALGVMVHEFQQGRGRQTITWQRVAWVLVGTAVGLLWYLLAARTHSQDMMNEFMMRENVGKLSTRQGSPLGLWGEFLGTLFPMLLWWAASMGSRGFRSVWSSQKRIWIPYALIPALFFTVFPYRVNTYLFILVPLAIWCMRTEPPDLPAWGRRVLSLTSVLIGCVFLIAVFRLHQGEWISTLLMWGFVVAVLVWVYGHLRLSPHGVGLGALLWVTGIRILGADLGERELAPLRSAHANASTEVAYVLQAEDIWHEYGWVSVALRRPVRLLRSDTEMSAFLEKGGLLILNEEQRSQSSMLQCEDWSRLKRRLKFPVSELLMKGLSFHDPALRRKFQLCRRTGAR